MTDSDDDVDGLPVSAAIESLRDELERAWLMGQGRPVQFGVEEISLKLNVAAVGKKAGSGKIRWWLVEAGGDVSKENSTIQTLELKLRPALVDPETGQKWPLQVSADESEPGM
jgi:hypothetical protein